jgi:F-type H+-transporting ATPase subunit epsilon
VQPDKVTVLASAAERADEIDIARAEAARARAEQLLKEGPPVDQDQYRSIEAALRRSSVRLDVARKRRRSQHGPSMRAGDE